MENQLIDTPKTKTITLLSYALVACCIVSCCARADYNLLVGFFILLIRGYKLLDKVKILTKIGIHLLALSLIFDLFWIYRYTSLWTHGDETSEMWRSLCFIHNLAYFLGVIEFLLKVPIGLFLYQQYIAGVGGQTKELLNFRYAPAKN